LTTAFGILSQLELYRCLGVTWVSFQLSSKALKFTLAQLQEFIENRTISIPKQVDRKSADKLPFAPGGGDYRKSTGDSLSERQKMKEEMAQWQ
jgi:hypothetical protein